MKMHASRNCYAFLKRGEELRLAAYQDQAGYWTIGYGVRGPDIHKGLRWTQDEAEEALMLRVQQFEKCVNEQLKVPLKQSQYDALIALVYNIGCEAFRTSTLLKRLNSNDLLGTQTEWRRWNKVRNPRTGKYEINEGLKNRRAMELVLFNSPDDVKVA